MSGIAPIHLLAEERAVISTGSSKEEARAQLMVKWQGEWENADKGRWTHRLIPDLKKWCSRRHGEVTFHVTQVLTGHGCFGSYLRRFHLQESEACAQCGASCDDAEHAFFECDAWEHWRHQTCGEIGMDRLTPDTIVRTMLDSPSNWSTIALLIKRVMQTRETEERRRQMLADGT